MAAVAAGLSPIPVLASGPAQERRKVVIVLFGGGVRSSETVDDPVHRFIPRLWSRMVPRGTLYTNMRIEGKVVHPNSAASIVTGHWEYKDLDWSQPVEHPTLFEIARKKSHLPDTAAWAFVYASILNQIGCSRAEGYGLEFAANVVEPPTIPRATAERVDALLRAGNTASGAQSETQSVREAAREVRSSSRVNLGGLRSHEARRFARERFERWQQQSGTTSHDVFLADCAEACLETFNPDVLLVAFGEIDCAHYGSWSRYTDAIRKTDELTCRLWETVNTHKAYRDKTLFLVLPDHGRELEREGGAGFIHHSDFYTDSGADESCRRVWMLALGPGMEAGGRIETPTPITAAARMGQVFLHPQ